MWRWSWHWHYGWRFCRVFSTYVEVILTNHRDWAFWLSILHVCGGDPTAIHHARCMCMYSPRMWRWSSKLDINTIDSNVFSTYVEVILNKYSTGSPPDSILHVCGGDPTFLICCSILLVYSPRMWRWSSVLLSIRPLIHVFSTYVEVIPIESFPMLKETSILHVCGGDPHSTLSYYNGLGYSPRMWRWSHGRIPLLLKRLVFSTYVEVIPQSSSL